MMMPWDGWPAGRDTPNWGGQGTSGIASSDIVYACTDLNARVTADMPVSIRAAGLPAEARPWLTNPQPGDLRVLAGLLAAAVVGPQGSGEAIIYATSRFADGFPRTFLAPEPALVNVDLIPTPGYGRSTPRLGMKSPKMMSATSGI